MIKISRSAHENSLSYYKIQGLSQESDEDNATGDVQLLCKL